MMKRLKQFAVFIFIFAALTLMIIVSASGILDSPPPMLLIQAKTPSLPPPTPTSAANSFPVGVSSTPPVDPAIRALLDKVQSDGLMQTVSTLADMHTRHILSALLTPVPGQGIKAARDWLIAQFGAIRDANATRSIDVWTQPVPMTVNGISVTGQNVITVLQGTGVGGGVVVIGAHYDSITADFFNGAAYAPGANDDASGIAALLEIARILAPLPHRATLMFVAFTAEETGRQGSLAFVKSYLQAQNPPIAVRGMINLDIIGSNVGSNGQQDDHTLRVFSAEPNDSTSRQLARQLALFVGSYLSDVTMVLQSAEERSGRWGDHQSFSAAGYPSVHYIEGLENPAHQRSALDTADNVEPGYLLRTTRAALVSTFLLADGPLPPTSIVHRSAPDSLVWTPVTEAVGYVVALRETNSLNYDQILYVNGTTQLTWDGLGKYAIAAVGSIDSAGRMGPLSPEIAISSVGSNGK